MNLEENIISTVHSAMTEAIKKSLEGYNSPLDLLIRNTVASHSGAISSLLNEAVLGALQGDFKEALKDACTRKLAKVVISKSEGEIEKRANELRADPSFRARLTVAIDEAIKATKA